MQKLILPLNKCQMQCGYKSQTYKEAWGFNHYGVDMYDPNLTLWAMGDGEIILTGTDSVFGNVVVARYNKCYIHKTGETRDLIARCYHLAKPSRFKKGDKISTKDMLGIIGTTGQYSSGVHLHVEFDLDTEYPLAVPGLKGNTSLFQKGIDTTIDPMWVLHVKKSAPDNQSIVANQSYVSRGFLKPEDYQIPSFEDDYSQLADKYNRLLKEYEKTYKDLNALEKKHNALLEEIRKLLNQYEQI